MLKLGRATVRTIMDLDPFRLPLQFLFPDGDMAALEAERPVLEPDHLDFQTGEVLLGVQSHLLQVGGLNILIDTCVGENKERPRRPDWHRRQATGYLDRLAEAGLRPEDIHVVLCTHLHADHAGWNTRLDNGSWVPTFPKARYVMGRTEHAHWSALEAAEPGQHNHGLYADSVAPVIEHGQAELVDDGFSLAEGLEIKPLPGHTPGQIGLCLCQGVADRRVLFCSDAIHSPVQVYQPGWSSRFCSDPIKAVETRQTLLDEAVADGTLLIPAHLRRHTAMGVKRSGGRFIPEFL